MSNKKILINSIMSTMVIIVGFIILFNLLGTEEEGIGLVVATILVFTVLFCTYSIIEEIRELKMTINGNYIDYNKKEENLEFEFSISLDFKPKNKELFIEEIKRYCTIENLNYDIISDEYNDMKCLIKINNIMYECILLYSGIASNYIISFNKI